MTPLTIETAHARVAVCPELGAGILSFTLQDGTAVFRESPASPDAPFDLACNILVPWCNRVSGGGFHANGHFHALEANLLDQPLPLHGNALQLPWTVTKHDDASIELALISRGPGPYHYEAHVRYALDGAALIVDLGVWHWGESPLPYGLGLHPWFDQDADTTVQFSADAVVLTDAERLPTKRRPLTDAPQDFSDTATLPADGIDNAFTGWSGEARLNWPSRGLMLDIVTDPPQPVCHVFSPGAASTFFCVEAVSHTPNAHNWPDAAPEVLQTLAQGEGLEFRTVMTPYQSA